MYDIKVKYIINDKKAEITKKSIILREEYTYARTISKE